MNPSLQTHSIGATLLVVGLSANLQVTPSAYQNKWVLRKFSGGSLAIVPGQSNIASEGYLMGDTEAVSIEGPASFYLAAVGATCTVQAMLGYTAGRS